MIQTDRYACSIPSRKAATQTNMDFIIRRVTFSSIPMMSAHNFSPGPYRQHLFLFYVIYMVPLV